MKSVLEAEEEEKEEMIKTKEKAEEDSFQALNLVPPTRQQTAFLKSNFGHSNFKPLQWKIIKLVIQSHFRSRILVLLQLFIRSDIITCCHTG